jgi:hypothetical protein
VTAEEVQAVAKERLRPDNRAVLVYEPLAAAAEAEDVEPVDAAHADVVEEVQQDQQEGADK